MSRSEKASLWSETVARSKNFSLSISTEDSRKTSIPAFFSIEVNLLLVLRDLVLDLHHEVNVVQSIDHAMLPELNNRW